MLKAYKLKRFYVCELTGITRIEEESQLNENLQVSIIEFSSRQNAFNHVIKHGRDWFFIALENWINHKIHIYKANGDNSRLILAESMRDVINNDLQSKKLSIACQRILKGKDKFLHLVPSQNNPSHENSLQAINELFSFCEENQNKPF